MESHCIEMDPGFILLGHSKTCTHGNEGQEEKIYTYRSPETLGTGLHVGPHGEATRVGQGGRGRVWPRAIIMVFKGRNGQSRVGAPC